MTRDHIPTCSRCGNDPDASCAGQPGCHGYYEGCDCPACEREHERCRKVVETGRGSMPAMPDEPKPL